MKHYQQWFVLYFLAFLYATIIYIIDLYSSPDFAVGSLYCVVILYSWLLPHRYSSFFIAFASTALIFLATSTEEYKDDSAGVNAIISLMVVWTCTSLVVIAKKTFGALEKERSSLEGLVKQRTALLEAQGKELRESEQLYRHLYEHAHEFYVSVSPLDGSILKCNQTFCDSLGYTKEELINQPVFSLYDPQCIEKVKLAFQKFKATGEVKNCELTLLAKNGEKKDVILNVSAVRDEHGQIVYSRSSWVDITWRKKAESEIAYLSNAIAQISDYSIILLDPSGNVKNWNLGAEKIKGYTADEIIDKNFRKFYTPEDQINGKPEELLKQAAEAGQTSDEGWRVKKDKTIFWANVLITAIHDEYGELTGFSKVTRDYTERKQTEEAREQYTKELESKNNELEQFAYVASHDLQEPLRTINGYTDFLMRDYLDRFDETGKKGLNYINNASNRMSQLIKGLLEYARIGRNGEKEQVDCNTVVDYVINDMNNSIDSTGAKVLIEDLPLIWGYETEMRMLFQNLISNAIKFRKRNKTPELKISSQQENGHWKFTVKDNGIGIPAQYQKKIFAIFQRLHKRHEYEGTGIGLAHCRKIIEMHKGSIGVDSKEGKGSAFWFTIPKN